MFRRFEGGLEKYTHTCYNGMRSFQLNDGSIEEMLLTDDDDDNDDG